MVIYILDNRIDSNINKSLRITAICHMVHTIISNRTNPGGQVRCTKK
jgi:hypothetical protein